MTRALGGFVVVAMLLLLCPALAFAADADRTARYVDREQGFSITLPQGWTGIPAKQQGVALLAASPKKRENGMPEVSLTVSISKFDTKADLDAVYNEVAASLPKQVQNFQQVDAGAITVGGEPGKYLIYTCSAAGTAMKGVSVFVVKGNRAASICCITTPEFYDGYESAFEETTGSFKFETQAAPKPGASNYTSPDSGFSITFPDGWTVSEPGVSGILVQAMSSLENAQDKFGESINVVATALSGPQDLDPVAREYVGALPKQLNAQQVGISSLKIGGRDARSIVFLASVGGMKLKDISYITCSGPKAYIITCSSEADKFEKYKPVFEKAIGTVKFAASNAETVATAIDKATGRWHDRRNGFSIVIPEGWTISSECPVGAGLALDGPAAASGKSPAMRFGIFPQWYSVPADLNAFSAMMIANAKKTMPPGEQVETSNLTIDGNPAKSFIFRLSVGSQRAKSLFIFTTKGHLALGAFFFATEDRYAANEETVIAAVKSVKFEPVTEKLPAAYTDKRFGYSITGPADWAQSEDGNKKTFTCPYEDAKDDFQEEVEIMPKRVATAETLDTYVERFRSDPKAPKDRVVLTVDSLKIADRDARRVLCTQVHEGANVKEAMYLVLSGDTLYIITCRAAVDKFEKYQSKFDGMVKSFALTRSQPVSAKGAPK